MSFFSELFQPLSIQRKFGGLLLLFAVLAVVNYGSIHYFESQQKEDASIVDTAGRNRMLSQKIGFLAERIMAGQEGHRTELADAITLHNTSLNVLKLGGIAPGIDGDPMLPPAPSRILPTLREVEALWKKYKEQAEILVGAPLLVPAAGRGTLTEASAGPATSAAQSGWRTNPTVVRALAFIERHASTMLTENDNLVKSYVRYNKAKQQRVDVLMGLLLALNLALIGLALYMVRKYIMEPTQKIVQITQRLSLGDLSATADYQRQDEMGRVVAHIATMTHNLKKVSAFAHDIGERKFATHFEPASEQDTLGTALLNMRDQLREVDEEEKKRKWAAEGVAYFSNLMQGGQEDLQGLTQRLLSELIKYVGANQGALFTVNQPQGEEPYLELNAMYAWGRKKCVQKQVKQGDDLLGQAWAEGETVHMTDIPADYVEITSGIGKATPRSLLIMPLKAKGSVLGMLEIASLQAFEPYQLEFMEKLGEGIASVLVTVLNNRQTRELLESSQRQTEQMQAQEEVMRQSMEELAATQEELLRKEKEYQRIIEEAQQKEMARIAEAEANGTPYSVQDRCTE